MAAKGLINELHNVTMLDSRLVREQKVIVRLSMGLAHVLQLKKPGMAATYLYRQLNNEASSERAAIQKLVNEDLKEIAAISGKNSFATLHGWDISASVGSGVPTAPQSALQSVSRSSSRSERGRHSPSKGQGGGRKTPMCGKCTAAGQPADHSFTACPLTECHKCKQKGHISRNCPN